MKDQNTGDKWLCFECFPSEKMKTMIDIMVVELNGYAKVCIDSVWKEMISEERNELDKLRSAVANLMSQLKMYSKVA